MKKKDRKKNYGYLKQHVGHTLRCDECNRGRPVRLEGFTPDGCMKIQDIFSKEKETLPKEYLEKTWRFGG